VGNCPAPIAEEAAAEEDRDAVKGLTLDEGAPANAAHLAGVVGCVHALPPSPIRVRGAPAQQPVHLLLDLLERAF